MIYLEAWAKRQFNLDSLVHRLGTLDIVTLFKAVEQLATQPNTRIARFILHASIAQKEKETILASEWKAAIRAYMSVIQPVSLRDLYQHFNQVGIDVTCH